MSLLCIAWKKQSNLCAALNLSLGCLWSKHSLSDDICERRLLIDSGMFLRIEGGWLDCLCTYNGTFPSFVYGRCFPVFRSRVTSKKFTLVTLASTVIFRSLSRKIFSVITIANHYCKVQASFLRKQRQHALCKMKQRS